MERDRDIKRHREDLERLEEKKILDRQGHTQGNLPEQDIYQDAIDDRGQEIIDEIRSDDLRGLTTAKFKASSSMSTGRW